MHNCMTYLLKYVVDARSPGGKHTTNNFQEERWPRSQNPFNKQNSSTLCTEMAQIKLAFLRVVPQFSVFQTGPLSERQSILCLVTPKFHALSAIPFHESPSTRSAPRFPFRFEHLFLACSVRPLASQSQCVHLLIRMDDRRMRSLMTLILDQGRPDFHI
jgi:hypothetical protein